MIKLKIDVTKINKNKLYKGEKGTYLNAVLIETPNSQYSDYMIIQETTKEEREAGIKGAILGNATEFKKDNSGLPPSDLGNTQPSGQNMTGTATDGSDDLPF